jgi:hypothetical protein
VAIYRFTAFQQRFESLDEVPDHRSDIEREASPVQVFDHFNPDISFAERRAKEALDVSGAWVKVFLKMPDIQDPANLRTAEAVWNEDPTPVYSNARVFKAFFHPDAQHIELTRFGIDAPLKISITFLRADLLKDQTIGDRLIQPGDQIEIPYNDVNEKKFPMRVTVVDATNDGNFRYRWLFWKVVCEVSKNDEMNQIKHD